MVLLSRMILLLSASILFAAERAHAFSAVGLGLPLSSTCAASAFSSRLRTTHRPGGALSGVRASVPGISYGQLQHCGVLVDDVKTAVDFYVNVLGMKDVSELRPTKLDYPGAFLACGKDQIHLMKVQRQTALASRMCIFLCVHALRCLNTSLVIDGETREGR